MGDPLVLDAFIEIPAGSQNKYEFDKERGGFRLDRVLYSAVHYPADYGFVPETLEEDGDPLDILVLTTFPTFPGCIVEARPVGLLEMEDEKGRDLKVLGVPVRDPRLHHVFDLFHLPPHKLKEIEHFFRVYKDLESKMVHVMGWQGREVALQVVQRARERYSGNGLGRP